MHAAEIVVEEIQGNLMSMVLEFLAESVGQASVPTHAHSHGEVTALHERRADVLRIGLASKNASATADTRCRTVARFRAIPGRSVQFDQHRVINLGAKSILHGIGINTMAVRRQLNAVADSGSNVLHERLSSRSATIPKRVRNDQLGIRIDCRPCPNISRALFHLFQCDILLLRVNERPNLIALHAANPEIADVRMVISSTGAAQVPQQPQHGVFSDTQHSAGCVDGVAFYQCAYDLALFIYGQTVHNVAIIRNRSRIRQEENALDFRDRSRIIKPMARKKKNPYAVALGRKGGRVGGPARAANMTPQERSESARNAVTARWAKVKSKESQ